MKLRHTKSTKIIRRLFIIDEARALGGLKLLEDVRDEGRSVGLHLMLIYQSFSQLIKAYTQDGAKAWLNSVDCYGFGPVQDSQQAEEICELIGHHTIGVKQKSKGISGKGGMTPNISSSESIQLQKKPLLTPDALRQLPRHGLILFLTDLPAILGSKPIWFTRAEFKNAKPIEIEEKKNQSN